MPHLLDLNGAPMNWAELHRRREAFYEARDMVKTMIRDGIVRRSERAEMEREMFAWWLSDDDGDGITASLLRRSA